MRLLSLPTLFVLLALFLTKPAHAEERWYSNRSATEDFKLLDGKYPDGIQLEISAGKGYASIKNPDNTGAYYSVLAVEGRGHIPLTGDAGSLFAADLVGGVRYLDFENTVQLGSEKEIANLIGPELGVHFRFANLIAGAQYGYIFARHYAIGPLARQLDYTTGMLNYYAGIQLPFRQLAISFKYSASMASIPSASTHLSRDSSYDDQTYWIDFTYSTGTPFLKFVTMLFGLDKRAP